MPQESSTISLNGNLKVRKGHSAERIAKEAIYQNTQNEEAFLSSTAWWQMATACCKLSAASCISLCSIPYALCLPKSAIRNVPEVGLVFALRKTTIILNQFSNKIKRYELQIYVCCCYIGKNYLLFVFVVFLLC
jgi:hypothetical protein